MTPQEFEELYHNTEKALFNCAYRWVWNREEALDLVQEAFMNCWEKKSKIEVATARPYLFKTVLNLSAKRLRWKKTWRWIGLENLHLFGKSLETAFFKKEEEQQLHRQINLLPQKQRQVLILVRFSELNYREVGKMLDIPEGTVASRYHKALTLIQENMGDSHGIK